MTTLTRSSPVGEPERGERERFKGVQGLRDRNILPRSAGEQTSVLRTVRVELLAFKVGINVLVCFLHGIVRVEDDA